MRTAEDPEGPPVVPGEPPPTRNLAWLQVLAFATIYLVWGSTYLAIRVAVATWPPLLLAGCRFTTAGAILYALARARGVSAPTVRDWLRGAVAGFLMLTLGNGLVTWAETSVASNLAALLIAATPLYVAILDWLRPGGTAPAARTWIGIVLGALGMVLLVAHGKVPGTAASPLAIAALLAAGLAWAAGMLYARHGGLHHNPLMVAAQQMIAGGVAQLVLAAARGEVHPFALSSGGLGAFVYLTLIGSLLTFSAYGWLLKVSTPSRVATAAYVNPVVAVILGWAILDETLGARALAGAAMIVCAVVVMTLKWPRAKAARVARRLA